MDGDWGKKPGSDLALSKRELLLGVSLFVIGILPFYHLFFALLNLVEPAGIRSPKDGAGVVLLFIGLYCTLFVSIGAVVARTRRGHAANDGDENA